MREHSFKIKKAINGVAYYGLIEISAEPLKLGKLIIEYDDVNVEQEWISSIDCAIRYFYYHYTWEEKAGLHVFVKRNHSMLIDTTPMTVFYATVKCLMELFNLSKELIILNENDGSYTVLR